MLALLPQRKRIAELLREDEQLREDLQNATSKDEADGIRADLYAVQHSLFLAGYSPEGEA